MRTLVIHPYDHTTDFLCRVYDGLEDATVIRQAASPHIVSEAILVHERVIALGHGTARGLLAVGKFGGAAYVLDDTQAGLMAAGKDNIYIWCNADQYVQRNDLLSPLYSGMFISEVGEAYMMGLESAKQQDVLESNTGFADVLNKQLRKGEQSRHNLIKDYLSFCCRCNDVAYYNVERLYANT